MTNYERIKAMTVDEMADFICSIYDEDEAQCTRNIEGYTFPAWQWEDIKWWLESEVQEDDR